MTHLYIGEILNSLKLNHKDVDAMERILRRNNTGALKECLFCNYDPRCTPLMAAEDLPPYRPDPAPYGLTYSSLYGEYDKISYFMSFKNANFSKVPKKNLERMYVNICESLKDEEAKYFSDIILQRLFIPNLDYIMINKVFGAGTIQPPIEIEMTVQNNGNA